MDSLSKLLVLFSFHLVIYQTECSYCGLTKWHLKKWWLPKQNCTVQMRTNSSLHFLMLILATSQKILNLCVYVGLGSLPYCESQLKKFQGANACNREPLLKAKAQCSDLLVLTSSDQLLFILQLLLLFQNNLP